jgi:non-specific serine/threonine protein kinase/serine/threonine-protein kinase
VLRGPIPNREQIVRQLRGDLDSIVGKAIRKNRFERYSSVEQLADDIRRHIEHLPVAAQPDTWPYRASKFVRRHSTAVVAGALIFGLFIAGIALTTYEARVARAERLRAEHRFNDVRKLANSLMFDVHDSIQNLPGATPARKVLVDRALEYLDSLAREVGNDPSLLQELASAYEKEADVQGNPSAANLGDSGGAVANFRKALALREHLARLDPKSESNQKKLAKDYQRIGLAQEASTENKSALESFQKAFAIHERLAQSDPNPELQEELGGDYFLLGHCYSSLAQPNAALEIYRKAAATLEAIPNPSAPVQSRLAATYSFTAGILQLQNQLAPAIVFQRKSLNLMKTISSANPGNARNREFLGEAYYWLGFFYERAIDTPKALEAYRSAADIVTPLSIADPKEARTKHYVALCDHSIGSILVHRGNAAEGLDRLNKSLQIYQELSAADTAGTSTQLSFIADAHATLGSAYAYLGAQHRLPTEKRIAYWKQARSEYRRSLDEWLQIKKRGVLSAFEIHETEDIAAELDKCDAALARLHAGSY